MDESDRSGARIRPRTRAVCTQVALDLIEEDPQGAIEGLTVMLKVVAQALGQGQDPLAHRQRGQYMIDEVSGGLGHAPRVARGADGAALTGEGYQEVLSALPTTRPGKAIGQDATLQVGTQLALGVRRDALIFPVVMAQGEEGLQVILHRAVKRCVVRAPPAVGGRRASLRLDGHGRIQEAVERL